MPLAEFAYNNNYQTSIQMAPYEALYGRRCRSPLCWDEVGERKFIGPNLIQQTKEKNTNNAGMTSDSSKATKKLC